MVEVKYRIASGNATRGNYALTAMLAETFPTGSYHNGALTPLYFPTLAAGKCGAGSMCSPPSAA